MALVPARLLVFHYRSAVLGRHTKLKQKQEDDIVVYEDLSGEVKFSKHLPYPNNLNRWVPLPQDPAVRHRLYLGNHSSSRDAIVLIHKIIDLGYAKELDQSSLCTSFVGTLQYLVRLQRSPNPNPNPSLHRAIGPLVKKGYWHHFGFFYRAGVIFPLLSKYLLHTKLKQKQEDDIVVYEDLSGEVKFSKHLPYPNNLNRWVPLPQHPALRTAQAVSREPLFQPGCNPETDPEKVLPYSPLRRTWSQAWHTTRTLKEDWQRVQQGQKAALMSLLRHNGTLSKQKNEMISMQQRLKAKLDFFKSSIQLDMEKYLEQKGSGIASEKMISAWREMQQAALSCGQVGAQNRALRIPNKARATNSSCLSTNQQRDTKIKQLNFQHFTHPSNTLKYNLQIEIPCSEDGASDTSPPN
ncbi:UNVERIFIED_CONTAM: hypothetical protein FKN15_026613 [Acipenser sinensis]